MDSPESEKKDVKRPMNAFLIFCKRHRAIVREKHPDLDNRSVTKILGDLWANLGEEDKSVYTKLAKQYKDAFMKANPDYKWYNPEKVLQPPTKMTTRPTNIRVLNGSPEISLDGKIVPGKLADPSNMGGLNLLLMAGQQFMSSKSSTCTTPEKEKRVTPPDQQSPKSALLELAEMCANELQHDGDVDDADVHVTKKAKSKTVRDQRDNVADFCQINQLNVNTDRHGDDTNVIRKPKSKPTKWKMKKSVESDLTRQQFEKSEIVVSEKFTSNNSKRIRRKSESCISEYVPRKMNTGDSQFKLVKQEFVKMKEIKFGGVFYQGGDNSSFGDQQNKKFRRTSNGETLAECLSDHSDNPVGLSDHGDSSTVSADDTKKILGHSGDEVKFKAKVKKKSYETGVKEEVKQEGMDVSFGMSVENVGLVEKKIPAVVIPEYTRTANRVEVSSKPVSDNDGRHLEKKQSSSPELENVHVKEEKSDPVFNAGNEEDQEMQPIRKSRRRNRGQRYQELIDEGIIQPSKERLAARRAEKSTCSCAGDNLLICNESFYDEEVVELRLPAKRSASETEITDERKYKTGDFDLEAHIAVLPACSLEQCPKGRKMAKVRHNSEGSPRKPISSDLAQTLILPPHVKVKSQEQSSEPVTGSRKRKARKHSITHLLSTKSPSKQTTSLVPTNSPQLSHQRPSMCCPVCGTMHIKDPWLLIGKSNLCDSQDPVKNTENSKQTILQAFENVTETTEKKQDAFSLTTTDKISQSTTIKPELPESEISICPESDAKSNNSNEAKRMQEKYISNVADKNIFPSIDENKKDDSLHDSGKDGGEENLQENCETSPDFILRCKTENISVSAFSMTAENELDASSRTDCCIPIVLSRTGVKSEIVSLPSTQAGNLSLQNLCQSVVTSHGLRLECDSVCSSEPVATDQGFKSELLSENCKMVSSDKTENESGLFGYKVSSMKKDIVDYDINSEKLLFENACVEQFQSSNEVTMPTGDREEQLVESSSTVIKSAQASVATITDKQHESHSMDDNSSRLAESCNSGAEHLVAIVTSSATIRVNEVAMVSSVKTTLVNPISYSATTIMDSTSATTVSPVAMATTSAISVSQVSIMSTSVSTMSPVSMVTTSATTVSPVSMVSTSVGSVMNPVAMVSSPVTAVASPVSAVSSPVTAVCS